MLFCSSRYACHGRTVQEGEVRGRQASSFVSFLCVAFATAAVASASPRRFTFVLVCFTIRGLEMKDVSGLKRRWGRKGKEM